MSDRKLVYVNIEDVVPADRNPKLHDASLGVSISRFGYVEPIVVDERTGKLVSGHGRVDDLLARRARGEEAPDGVRATKDAWKVPVIRGWASASDAEAEAFVVAANRVGELGGWDPRALEAVLAALAAVDQSLLDATGYTRDEIEALRAKLDPSAPPEFPDAETLAGHVEHRCPRCGYEWSGSATPNASIGEEP